MLTLGPIMSSSLSSTTACGVWYIAWGKFEWLHGGRVKGVCIVHNILHSSRLTKWGMVGLSPWECLVRSWSWAVWGCFSLICASDDLMGFSFFLCIRWIDTYIHTQTHTYIMLFFFFWLGIPGPILLSWPFTCHYCIHDWDFATFYLVPWLRCATENLWRYVCVWRGERGGHTVACWVSLQFVINVGKHCNAN